MARKKTTQKLSFDPVKAKKQTQRNPYKQNSQPLNCAKKPPSLPIPKGNTPYCKAKQAEYIAKDPQLAKLYYYQAIWVGDRIQSAVKDLAAILHQEGNTLVAINLLSQFQNFFSDQSKFKNLMLSFKKQLASCCNSHFRYLRVYPLNTHEVSTVLSLFKNTTQLEQVDLVYGEFVYALLKFPSYSAAQKTLGSFAGGSQYFVEFVSEAGEVKSAGLSESSIDEADESTARLLLGEKLFDDLHEDFQSLSPMAIPFIP